MAVFVTKPLNGAGFDTENDADITVLGDYDHLSTSSSLAKFYDDALNYVTFAGSGFRYTTQSGSLTDVSGGTITKIVIEVDGVKTLTASGLHLSASSVFDYYVNSDRSGAIGYLFSGNDTILGSSRADTLSGHAGHDRIKAGAGIDVVFGGAGTDMLSGGSGNDMLHGGDGKDTLKGDAGRDMLFGEAGNDILYGGSGADTFRFDIFTGLANMGVDTIADFHHAQHDRIDLSPLDATAGGALDNAFSFIGSQAFSKTQGELRAVERGAYTYVQGDTDGDGIADLIIKVKGAPHLSAADFLL